MEPSLFKFYISFKIWSNLWDFSDNFFMILNMWFLVLLITNWILPTYTQWLCFCVKFRNLVTNKKGICNKYKLVFGKQLPITHWHHIMKEKKLPYLDNRWVVACCSIITWFLNFSMVLFDVGTRKMEICNLHLCIVQLLFLSHMTFVIKNLSTALNKLHKTIVENLDKINNQCI